MRRLRIAVFACLAVVLLAACDAGWVQPLGGPDHASYNATENVLTLANVTTLQQAFHTSVVGTPVVKDGVLVLGNGNTVTAFDGTTGAQQWQVTLPDQINGGPFIEGTTVRVSYGPGGPLYGPSNEVRIDLFLGGGQLPQPTIGGMVALRGDNSVRLQELAGSNAGFVQIGGMRLDGEVANLPTSTTFGPKYLYLLYGNAIAPSSEGLAAYDPDQPCVSGVCAPVWNQTFSQFLATPAIGPDGTLYLAGGDIFNPGLTAVDGNTGSVKWTAASNSVGTPAVANGVVYSFTSDPATFEGGFAALSAADGHTLWTGTTAVHDPTVAGGVVYGTAGNVVVAYNANGCGQATCAPIWTASLGTDTASGGLAVSGGMLYVGTNTGVTAFKPTA